MDPLIAVAAAATMTFELGSFIRDCYNLLYIGSCDGGCGGDGGSYCGGGGGGGSGAGPGGGAGGRGGAPGQNGQDGFPGRNGGGGGGGGGGGAGGGRGGKGGKGSGSGKDGENGKDGSFTNPSIDFAQLNTSIENYMSGLGGHPPLHTNLRRNRPSFRYNP